MLRVGPQAHRDHTEVRPQHVPTLDDGVRTLLASRDIGVEAGHRGLEPGSHPGVPDLLAQPGCWTKQKPSRSEKKDIELGWKMAKEIGRLDIGQCVVVGGGSVLAVEAIDGTDATIMRGGKLGRGDAVVVKVCKPNQDIRFDIPAVGAETIKTMEEAGAKVLVVEAGKAIVFDRQEMINLADEFGITIVAMET